MLAFLLYRLTCGLLRLLVRAGVDERELEIAVLRHQLWILDRQGKRARYGAADRAFLAAVSRFLPRERWSVFPVVPETLKRWRRQLEARKDPREAGGRASRDRSGASRTHPSLGRDRIGGRPGQRTAPD